MPQIESSVNRSQNGISYDDIPVSITYSYDNGEVLIEGAEASEDIPFMYPEGHPLPAPYFIHKGEYVELTPQEISRLEEKIATDEIGSRHDDAYERYKDKYQ